MEYNQIKKNIKIAHYIYLLLFLSFWIPFTISDFLSNSKGDIVIFLCLVFIALHQVVMYVTKRFLLQRVDNNELIDYKERLYKENYDFPYIRTIIAVSFVILIPIVWVSTVIERKGIDSRPDTVLFGTIVNVRKYHVKTTTHYEVKYNYKYNSKSYEGDLSSVFYAYGGYYYNELGVPILIDDKYAVVVDKKRPWKSKLLYNSIYKEQLLKLRYIIYCNSLDKSNVGMIMDSIYKKYSYNGLVCYYHLLKNDCSPFIEHSNKTITKPLKTKEYLELVKRLELRTK